MAHKPRMPHHSPSAPPPFGVPVSPSKRPDQKVMTRKAAPLKAHQVAQGVADRQKRK